MEAGGGRPTPPGRPEAPTDPAPATVEQRLEGLRAWIAQLDRRLGVRTYIGAAVAVLALAAGIVGVVLALSAKDESATREDVSELRGEVEDVQRKASETAEDELTAITERLDALDERVSSLASNQRTSESELQVVKDDIDELREQVAEARQSDGGGSP